MTALETLLFKKIFPSLQKLKAENVIFPQKAHPKRTEKQFPVPDYLENTPPFHETPEICLCVKGRFAVRLGKYTYILQPRDICLIDRNLYHYEAPLDKEGTYETIWLRFDLVEELIINHFRYIKEEHTQLGSIHTKCTRELVDILDAVFEAESFRSAQYKVLQELFTVIEHQVENSIISQRDLTKKNRESHYQRRRIEKAKQYIDTHYAKDMRVDEVARFVGMNTSYFETQFRAFEGNTFIRYLTTLRLQKAQVLLNKTEDNISEIAFKCGFRDPYYFSRVFKKYTGISPRHSVINIRPAFDQ